ncbi:type III PLP-dependent enzyme [Thermodesulfovibrio thiophilus]|uniref:type III PLP-dependent enzyme n=1 Tax=Thermodesulfovibrio thiophilus TaxID=340095 RepID=UPI000403DB45|nr:type III PLP-dependent enzyme [Thermodesulfovibrio thiophilus]
MGNMKNSLMDRILNWIACHDDEPPFLLVDREILKEKISLIGRGIKNSRVFYAVKANPDIEVIKYLSSFQIGFEIASEGELAILKQLNIEAERIITSNPIKTFKFLREAAEYGIDYFAFDSVAEVDKLAKYLPGKKVYVRLSVPNEGSEWPLSKKFGVEIEEAVKLLIYARKKGLDPVGITFHVGSQCSNVYNWHIAIDKAHQVKEQAFKEGIEIKMLNIGGGYPIQYLKKVPDIETIELKINSLLQEYFPETEIFIEPGRAVIGDAGVFVSKIIGKAKRGNENWLYIDVGVFNGLMESIGGIRYQYIVGSRLEEKEWTVAGPSCDSMDVLDKSVLLSEPDVGSLILILSAGAYTISYASEFNGFSIPKTFLI